MAPKNNNLRTRTVLAGRACAAVLLLLAALLMSAPGNGAEKLKVGDAPPPINWQVKLSHYRGRIVLIAFWASWCPPCRREMPVLAKLQQAATRKKVVVFAIDYRESGRRFRALQRALKGVDLTLLRDSSGAIGRSYDVDSLPHLVIVGRDGRIAAIHLGYSKSEIPWLVAKINSLWNQAPPPAAMTRTANRN